MTAQIIDGKALSRRLRVGFRERVERLKERGVSPGLAVILVGDNPASRVYVGNKIKACEECGVRSLHVALAADVSEVEVLATDPWRYGYRLWLEKRSGLPLRVDLLDGQGRSIEQVAFTDISLDQRPSDADLQTSAEAGLVRVSPLPSHTGKPARWFVPAPPAGFRLRATRPLPDEGVHLLYSDGLASVSVYVERVGGGLRGDARRQRGAVHARSFWLDGWQVLAIGKVPAATVERPGTWREGVLAHRLEIEVHFLQDVDRNPLAELDETQQQVLGTDIRMVEAVCLLAC